MEYICNPIESNSKTENKRAVKIKIILSPASEVGSPTNPPWAPGSNKTWGRGILWSVHRWIAIATEIFFKKKWTVNGPYMDPLFTKTG